MLNNYDFLLGTADEVDDDEEEINLDSIEKYHSSSNKSQKQSVN